MRAMRRKNLKQTLYFDIVRFALLNRNLQHWNAGLATADAAERRRSAGGLKVFSALRSLFLAKPAFYAVSLGCLAGLTPLQHLSDTALVDHLPVIAAGV